MAKCRHVLSLCTSLRNNPSQLYQSLLGQLNEYAMNMKINFRVCMNEESDGDLHFLVRVYFCADHQSNCIRPIAYVCVVLFA